MPVYRRVFYIYLYFMFVLLVTTSDVFKTNQPDIFPEVPIVPSWSNVSSCRDDSNLYISALKNKLKWAVEMWDASAKIPTGWLYGNEAQLGNYDQCKNVDAPFSQKFCVGKLFFKNSQESSLQDMKALTVLQESRSDRSAVFRGSILWGICVPSSCPPSDFQILPANFSNRAEITGQWSFTVTEELCTHLGIDEVFTYGEIIFWCVTILWLAVIAIATILTMSCWQGSKSENEQAFGKELLQCFALQRTLPKLLAYNPNTKVNPLGIFHGLRFASVVFVLYAHRTGIPLSFSSQNQQDWESELKGFGFKFVAQTDMTVDTFFFISGVLLSFSLLKKSFQPVLLIISRLFRLMPLFLWVIFFEAYAVPRLGSGPLWQAVQGTESEMCAKNWWLSALFLQNYVNNSEMCMTHTWYIPCEMHFFLASLIILKLINYKEKFGLSLLVALCAAFIAVPGIIVFWKNMDPLVLFYFPDFLGNPRANKTFLEVYVKSHNRAAVYLIGLLAGYYLSRTNSNFKKSNLKRSIGLFVLSLVLMGIPMLYGVHFYSPVDSPSPMEKGIFAALRRPIWALGLFCLVIANTWGPIPILNPVFTSRPAVVLGRISYGLYLLHFPIIMANMAKMRQAPVFNWFDVIFSGDLASTCIFASILYVLLEEPARMVFMCLLIPKQSQKATPALPVPEVESSRV